MTVGVQKLSRLQLGDKTRRFAHLAEGFLVCVGGNLLGDGDADVSAVGLACEDVDSGFPCGKKRNKEVKT